MARKAVTLAFIAAVFGAPLWAQDANLDDVLNNYYEAIGGLEAWKSVESMKATGKMMMGQGMEAPFTMIAKRPRMFRLEFTFQGMTGVQAYDGETAWMLMPFFGKTEAELMPPEEAEEMEEQADIDGVLVDYEDKGHQVELLGVEEIEGTEAYKLKVTLKSGDIRYYYLDGEYYVPIKVEGSRAVRGTEVEFETIISDYKEVGGLMIAHSIENKPRGAPSGQVITIDEVELNVEVDDENFIMPKSSEPE